MTKLFTLVKLGLVAGLLCWPGCAYFPLRPGVSKITTTSQRAPATAFLRQSQNPQQASIQKFERITEVAPPTSGATSSTVLRTEERGETTIGAAQKDTAREISAKLGSLKGVVWIGILVFLFGAASAVYPPLKILVGGSVTTSIVIAASGLALIVLPSLVVGHEVLILAGCAGAAGIYWFAHRHGSVTGELATLKTVVGIPANPRAVVPPKV